MFSETLALLGGLHLTALQTASLIPVFPLAAAVIITFFGSRLLKGGSHAPAIIGVGISFVLAFALLMAMQSGKLAGSDSSYLQTNLWTWITAGGFKAPIGVFVDPLSSLFLAFVTGISLLIFIYSSGYMAGDYGYYRFFAYLSFFVFSMTVLVLANNFLLVYLGWEGVGLASYLLVGYYYPKPAARDAATKAFVVNRIGDACFAVAIFIIYLNFHSLQFADVLYAGLANPVFIMHHHTAIFWITLLLMLAAFAKSAQFPLHVWLPDAMEGPTPVSALIHAATMVTAGIYLIARCMPLFRLDVPVLHLVGIVGCFTAFMAATIATCQYDIKRIFAYSTVSQLGYMFMALGVAAGSAAVFHVFTHAFFKALLFLSAGSVMHAMGGELDFRKMSGLRKRMPITTVCILMGCLALAGMPPWAGFFSKGEILDAAMNSSWRFGPTLAIFGMLTALITAYYTFRVFFRAFMGPEILPETAGHHEPSPFALPAEPVDAHHGMDASHDAHGHSHAGANGVPVSLDGSIRMWGPLVLLALGATLVGLLGVFGGHGHAGGWFANFLSPVHLNQQVSANGTPQPVSAAVRVNSTVMMGLDAALALGGILIAFYFHLSNRAAAPRVAATMPGLVRFLENKWYFDELYDYTLVRPLRLLGHVLSIFDRFAVDGLVFLVGFAPQLTGYTIKPTQSGRLRYYGIGMVTGVAVVILGVLYLLR